jgi:chromatin assembly factor 1 subunit A
LIDDEGSKDSTGSTDTNGKSNFMPFQVHGQMRLAPCVRYQLSSSELSKLDAILSGNASDKTTYLKELKNGRNPRSSGKTWPQEDKAESEDSGDVIVVDELQGVGEDIKEDDAHLKMKHRTKFLMFHENRRPAYHGTWRKNSKKVTARRPLGHDMVRILN